jgi:hypothetical protein
MASNAAAAGCGTTRAHGGNGGALVDVQIQIVAGPVSCHAARKVATDSINSHAAFHGHGSAAYRVIDGWFCFRLSLGYAPCLLNGSSVYGRYSPAGCAPAYDRGLPHAAGGPRHHDSIGVLALSNLSCIQAVGLAHAFDVPHYSGKSPPQTIPTSLGSFQCRSVALTKTTVEGICTLNVRRAHWFSSRAG